MMDRRRAEVNLLVVNWATNEVIRQHGGAREVENMLFAWTEAHLFQDECVRLDTRPMLRINYDLIAGLNYAITTGGSIRDYSVPRRTPVYFIDPDTGHQIEEYPAEQVVPALQNLIDHGEDLNVDEWVGMFLKIHPFEDGNGRLGAILYNMFKCSLSSPATMPYDLFKVQPTPLGATT